MVSIYVVVLAFNVSEGIEFLLSLTTWSWVLRVRSSIVVVEDLIEIENVLLELLICRLRIREGVCLFAGILWLTEGLTRSIKIEFLVVVLV